MLYLPLLNHLFSLERHFQNTLPLVMPALYETWAVSSLVRPLYAPLMTFQKRFKLGFDKRVVRVKREQAQVFQGVQGSHITQMRAFWLVRQHAVLSN